MSALDDSLLFGLDDVAQKIYLFMLINGSAGENMVAVELGISEELASSGLEDLRELGLLARRVGERGDYAAVDPRFALRALADGLNARARLIQDRTKEFGSLFDQLHLSANQTPQTTVISDPAEVAGWYARLQHQVATDFMMFDRPPYVTAAMDPLETASLRRGVTWRAIYTSASFDQPGTWEEVEELGRQGEQARVVPELPVKLAISDRSVALVSLLVEPGRVETLVTESPALVAALCQLFEFHWERAYAIPIDRELDARRPPLQSRARRQGLVREATVEERTLLALIASGMKDESIARQLGSSPRTVRRRGKDLMNELGATNRFQAGVEAAHRGWI